MELLYIGTDLKTREILCSTSDQAHIRETHYVL